jgi:hypothetical protein
VGKMGNRVKISMPIENPNSLYLPVGRVDVVNIIKGVSKWKWISVNKEYNNLNGEPVIFVKPSRVVFYLDNAGAVFTPQNLAIEVGLYGYIHLMTLPNALIGPDVLKLIEENFNGRAIFDGFNVESPRFVLKLGDGDYVFVNGKNYFLDIFIYKNLGDFVYIYQKTKETEEMLQCRLSLMPSDVGVEVPNFFDELQKCLSTL